MRIERLFDAPPQFATDRPLFTRDRLDAQREPYLYVGKIVDTNDLQIFEQICGELGIMTQARPHLHEQRYRFVHIDTITHANMQHRVGIIFGQICDRGDGAIGNHVHTAVKVSQNEDTQAELFDEPGLVSYFDDITDADLIFQEEKEAGNHITDQILRAKADCQPTDASRRQKRSDIEPYLFEYEHRSDNEEDGSSNCPDDLTQSLGALLELNRLGEPLEHAVEPDGQQPDHPQEQIGAYQ